MTYRTGLPLHRIIEQPRRARSGFWRKHGAQTFWFLVAIAALAGPLAYAEWALGWLRGAIQ